MGSMNIRPIVLLLALVSIMVVIGCSAAPTPSGPSFTKEEAIAVLKQHLEIKHPLKTSSANCGMFLVQRNIVDLNMAADYDPTAHRWDIGNSDFGWSVYERTGAVVTTGSERLNQLC